MKELHTPGNTFRGGEQTMVESAIALIQTNAMVYSFHVNRRREWA